MKALILNSGVGNRMGYLTKSQPKCMTSISQNDTILSRQLFYLAQNGINDIVITTGYYDKEIQEYCMELEYPLHYNFVKNNLFAETNYIYSIYCAKDYIDDDILLMHGDIVFNSAVLQGILQKKNSYMTISTTSPLPKKDFKAVVKNGLIKKVGIEFFDSAVAAQAIYKLNKSDWKIWLEKIIEFCETGRRKCYAEVAFNEISDKFALHCYDTKNLLCREIDTIQDLYETRRMLRDE
jgi:phosphoenolpyruvate phosphomutase